MPPHSGLLPANTGIEPGCVSTIRTTARCAGQAQSHQWLTLPANLTLSNWVLAAPAWNPIGTYKEQESDGKGQFRRQDQTNQVVTTAGRALIFRRASCRDSGHPRPTHVN